MDSNLSRHPARRSISPLFFTTIFRYAHLMHSRLRFPLETVVVLQYRCAQSGTSYLHTAVAALRDGSWYNASCGCRQLRSLPPWAAHSFYAVRSTPNHRAADSASLSSSSSYGYASVRTARSDTVAPELPLSARQQASPAPRVAAPCWPYRSTRAKTVAPASIDAAAVPHRATCGWLARRSHCISERPAHALHAV